MSDSFPYFLNEVRSAFMGMLSQMLTKLPGYLQRSGDFVGIAGIAYPVLHLQQQPMHSPAVADTFGKNNCSDTPAILAVWLQGINLISMVQNVYGILIKSDYTPEVSRIHP